MDLTKENLLNLIKEYSIPEFDDLNIYSMPYFQNVLINYYQNRDCTIIYGDFDKVNDSNLKYGRQKTDEIIHTSLTCIREAFHNADIVRIAGDEFLIINKLNDDSNASSINNRLDIHSINNKLDILNEHYLSIEGSTLSCTFGAVNIMGNYRFYDGYSSSEKIVDRKKAKSVNHDSEKTFDEILKSKMNENLRDFFDNFRFSNYFKFTNANVQTLGDTAVNSAVELLLNKEYTEKALKKKNSIEDITALPEEIFSHEETEIIHDYISGKNMDPEKVNLLSQEKLETFLDGLIRNPNTGFYNKFYFEKFFKEKAKNSEYATIVKADTTGIKNCNTKYSHLETDHMLKDLSSCLKSNFTQNLNLEFDDKNFDFDNSANYLFDMGGGNFVALLKEHYLSFPEYIDIFEKVNNSSKELGIVSSYTTSLFSLEESLANLNYDCNSKKIAHKKSELQSDVSKEALELFISDSVNFYLTNSENPNNLENQQEFLSTLFDSVVDNALIVGEKYKLSKEMQKNEVASR